MSIIFQVEEPPEEAGSTHTIAQSTHVANKDSDTAIKLRLAKLEAAHEKPDCGARYLGTEELLVD